MEETKYKAGMNYQYGNWKEGGIISWNVAGL
jgi:hypothetical protein